MEKERAINILIAHACCCSDRLGCADCPLRDENAQVGDDCIGYSDSNLAEAVKALKN